MSQRLNQVLAVERNVKSRVHSELTELHKSKLSIRLWFAFSNAVFLYFD